MDRETLERLCIDQSMGSLTDDMQALLNAYLETHPEAAAMARQIDDTVALARHSYEGKPVSSLPKFPETRLLHAVRSKRRWRLVRFTSGLAACWLIGLGLGSLLFHRAPAVTPSAPQSVVVENVHKSLFNDTKQQTSDFWSVQRIIEEYRSMPRPSRKTYIWESPFSLPKLGDKT